MSSNNEDIGYIKGKVQTIEEEMKKNYEQCSKCKDRLQDLEQEVSFYRHILLFVRAVFWIATAIVTLKFGDIVKIFKGE